MEFYVMRQVYPVVKDTITITITLKSDNIKKMRQIGLINMAKMCHYIANMRLITNLFVSPNIQRVGFT